MESDKKHSSKLQPTRFEDFSGSSILRILAFPALSSTTEIPLSEKQTGGYNEHRWCTQKKADHALEDGHDRPFAVVGFREHKRARTVEDLQKGIR